MQKQQKTCPDIISLDEDLEESAKWYLSNEGDVNKKPYFEYIDKRL